MATMDELVQAFIFPSKLWLNWSFIADKSKTLAGPSLKAVWARG